MRIVYRISQVTKTNSRHYSATASHHVGTLARKLEAKRRKQAEQLDEEYKNKRAAVAAKSSTALPVAARKHPEAKPIECSPQPKARIPVVPREVGERAHGSRNLMALEWE